MIKSKQELSLYISEDNNWLIPATFKSKMIDYYSKAPKTLIKKYLYYLRKQEFFLNTTENNKLKKFLCLYYERRKNLLGERVKIDIGPNCFGKGLNIWHGGIIVNSTVRAGDNCTLHGGNCIGNNGKTDETPVLGNNIDIGYGAVIIGGIRLADNIKVGANAVVNKSFLQEGCTIVGAPAHIVK